MFNVKKEVFLKILEKYERNEKSFQEDVNTITEWIKTQPHLPEIMDKKRVQNFLIMNKCRIERTKQQIDNYYTIRSVIPEFLLDADSKEVQLARDTMCFIQLPQLTPEGFRVHIIKVRQTSTIDSISLTDFCSHGMHLQEIRLKEDTYFKDVGIIDIEGMTWTFLLKITPSQIFKILKIYEKVFSNRLAKIYVVNAVPFIQKIIAMVKAFMKPKLFERIHIYNDSEILKQELPINILPKEFGGEGFSLDQLYELQKLKLKEYREYLKYLKDLRVNESLRPEKLKDDEILGFHGNFKKLDVD